MVAPAAANAASEMPAARPAPVSTVTSNPSFSRRRVTVSGVAATRRSSERISLTIAIFMLLRAYASSPNGQRARRCRIAKNGSARNEPVALAVLGHQVHIILGALVTLDLACVGSQFQRAHQVTQLP